jgi:membrane protein implicated in regulation of membrane protease activity
MKKAMIMPIVFSVIFVCMVGLYSLIFFIIKIPLLIKIIVFLIITGLAATMIYLLLQRNRELKEEEENDFSKY